MTAHLFNYLYANYLFDNLYSIICMHLYIKILTIRQKTQITDHVFLGNIYLEVFHVEILGILSLIYTLIFYTKR